MGANAQTSVPLFSSGEVLTAANQNISAGTGVPVFATTTTRDAAFGGTGEKVLAEGQLCYIEASDVVQYYNGTAWATLGPASSSALTLISSTTIGSAVSSVTVSGAFSSTYDNYLILFNGGSASVAADFLYLTLGSTSSGYNQGGSSSTYPASNLGSERRANTTSWYGGYMNTAGINGQITLMGPNMTENTFINAVFASGRTSDAGYQLPGFLNDTTAYTAFTLTTGSGTITGGTIRVYGYANS
jgi:hypothetical protein